MLARLQQAIIIGGVMLALLWAWVCWLRGEQAWGAAGAAAFGASYAAVLAVEFALLRCAHRTDAAPRASATQLIRAWCSEVRAAPLVFCWRQPFLSARWPDHLPDAAHGRRGVLLIHGFFCNRGVWNRWLQRLTALNVPTVAVNLEPLFGSIDNYVPVIDVAVRTLERCTGLPPLVVAHSMGGLALRRWWAVQADPARVQWALTIATPHRGTWLARFGTTRNARQMRQHSQWLLALAASEPASRAGRFTCFFGNCDNIVFPPSNATLPGADNRHLAGVPHVHMVDHDTPWQALLEQLDHHRPEANPANTAAT